MMKRKTIRTGIYARTVTTIRPSDPEWRDGTAKAAWNALSNPIAALDEIEVSLRARLVNLGAIEADLKSGMANHSSGFLLPKTPRPVYGDNTTLARADFDRTKEAMEHLQCVRLAIDKSLPECAAIYALKLGHKLAMIEITPHEPNAKRGRDDKVAKLKGSRRGNATKKREAAALRKEIVILIDDEIRSHPRRSITRIQSEVAEKLEKSERTVKTHWDAHTKSSETR